MAGPGVILPYNLITDNGGAVNPHEPTNIAVLQPFTESPGIDTTWQNNPAIFFITTNGYDETQPPYYGAMLFNQLGMMAGPATYLGAANPGCVVTLTLHESLGPNPGQPQYIQVIGQATVDLTNATPGQFYWSAPLPHSMDIYGYGQRGSGQYTQNVYIITINPASQYVVYTNRPCTVRNGDIWGSHQGAPVIPAWPVNDHLFALGGVDLSLTHYQDLGTAKLSPGVSFSGNVKRKDGLGVVNLTPKIGIKGQPQRRGAFDGGAVMEPQIVLNASMAGGPLWKPSKLCTG